jgi:hypothetical protein
MKTNSLLGLARFMIPVPAIIGQRLLPGKASKERTRLATIRSEAHHLVRDFVTGEIKYNVIKSACFFSQVVRAAVRPSALG